MSKTIDSQTSTYSYDAKNYLASAELNEAGAITSTAYQYNIDGIRVQKSEAADITDYLIDPNRDYAQVVRETDSSTATSIDYLYRDDLIRQNTPANGYSYYLYDGLGSTRYLTNSLGAVTDSYDYDAFGSTLNQTGTTGNNYLFTGE